MRIVINLIFWAIFIKLIMSFWNYFDAILALRILRKVSAKNNSSCFEKLVAALKSRYHSPFLTTSSTTKRDHIQSYPTRYVDPKPVIGLSTGVSFRWLCTWYCRYQPDRFVLICIFLQWHIKQILLLSELNINSIVIIKRKKKRVTYLPQTNERNILFYIVLNWNW